MCLLERKLVSACAAVLCGPGNDPKKGEGEERTDCFAYLHSHLRANILSSSLQSLKLHSNIPASFLVTTRLGFSMGLLRGDGECENLGVLVLLLFLLLLLGLRAPTALLSSPSPNRGGVGSVTRRDSLAGSTIGEPTGGSRSLREVGPVVAAGESETLKGDGASPTL